MFENPKFAKTKKIDTSGFQLIEDIAIDASSDVEYSEELSIEGEYYDWHLLFKNIYNSSEIIFIYTF